MGIIRNTASALMKGRVGNTTYYVSGKRQIARVSQNSSNYGESARRTEAMQDRRSRWANLVNFYKVSQSWMKYAFETKSAKQSDYNKFMSVNLNSSTIYLTRDQASLGGCVVMPYNVSQGSLRTINVSKVNLAWRTDIALGSLSITGTTTVAQFTEALLEANNGLKEGMQLSFISYQQLEDSNATPQVVCTAYEVTLSKTNEDILRDYLPEFCSTSLSGFLGTNNAISPGAFAYMWSITEGGKTRVSTQTLVNNNFILISKYMSDVQRNAAIESYGVDTDAFLMSGSTPQIPTAATTYIEFVYVPGSGNVTPNSGQVVTDTMLSEKTANIRMSRVMPYNTLAASITMIDGSTIEAESVSTSTGQVFAATWPELTSGRAVRAFDLTIDGVTYSMLVL